MLIVSISAKSQNYVGETMVDIVNTVNDKGYTVSKDYTNSGKKMISYSDEDGTFFAHYFTDNNVCFMSSVYFPKGTKKTTIETALKDVGYYESSYNEWKTQKYIVDIEWDPELNRYILHFKINIK